MKTEEYDIVVIGSGIAGLHYAIRCSEFARVLILTKGTIGESNTMYAQGGIAAVFDKEDTIESHVADTLRAGDGLCNRAAVELLATHAKSAILELERLQVHFDKTSTGAFDLHLEGGHSHNRIVHQTDATGKEVETSLVRSVRNLNNIAIRERCFVIDLLVTNNICEGLTVLNTVSNEVSVVRSKLTMLAAGGAGQLYRVNTNPPVATGDGFAIASRAGATMKDMEFVQFHPTTLYSKKNDTFLISEAIRGFGAELKNKKGQSFMDEVHPLKSLAPRDIVTRAIIREMNNSGEPCVYLDLRKFDPLELKKQFPTIYQRCTEEGLDLSKDMIPVVPAAHYMCGGVKTDLKARTSIKNLYACGECACTGVHGANRLASNSLLEGIVFSTFAADDSREVIDAVPMPQTREIIPVSVARNVNVYDAIELRKIIQSLMWSHAGIIRNKQQLKTCLGVLDSIESSIQSRMKNEGISMPYMELLNMTETARLIAVFALRRKENRGCHFRSDAPYKLPENEVLYVDDGEAV